MKKTIRHFIQLACFFPLLMIGKLNAVCDQAWFTDADGNIIVINTETQMQTSLFFSGGSSAISGIAFTPDGSQAFFSDQIAGVWAINTATQMPTQISSQTQSADIAISPDGQFAYVPYFDGTNGSILKVNTATHTATVLNAVPYPLFSPAGIAITPDGSQLYITGLDTGTLAHEVLVVSASDGSVLHTIVVPSVGNLFKIAITPNGSFAYVTETFGQVFQINTVNFAVAVVSTDGFLPFLSPFGVAIHPNSQFAYVTDSFSNFVDVIQISSNTVVNQIMDPDISNPEGIAVTPDGNFLYVANANSSNNIISVINTSSFAVNDVMTTSVAGLIWVAISPPCSFNQVRGKIVENKDLWQTDIFSKLCWTPLNLFTTQYLIYRNGVEIASLSPGTTQFEDHYLRHGKKYIYSIYAVNSLNQRFLVGTVTLATE